MRPRAKRRISCTGQEVGKCTRIIVFISTTRAAILMRRRRNVSNWATRHIERFGIDFQRNGEGKPKEKGRKIQAFTFHESGLFKGLHANSVKVTAKQGSVRCFRRTKAAPSSRAGKRRGD